MPRSEGGEKFEHFFMSAKLGQRQKLKDMRDEEIRPVSGVVDGVFKVPREVTHSRSRQVVPFRVPVRGSVNPSPLGDG